MRSVATPDAPAARLASRGRWRPFFGGSQTVAANGRRFRRDAAAFVAQSA